MMKLLRSSKGFGILEALIGFAILGVGGYVILNGLDFIGDKKTIADRNASMENMISNMLESIRSNIAMEKVDFTADDFLNNTTYQGVKNSLKMCWVRDGLIPLELYPNCPGRIGYVVTPMKTGTMELRGLYKVSVRITHDELFPGTFKQYDFIVKDP